MNILFTCAGRRNYLINYFKEALNNQGLIIATDADSYAPSLADAHIGIVVPLINDSNYLSALKNIIVKYDVDAIISLNDLELPFMSKHKNELENEFNIKVIISNEDVISIAFDKFKTYQFLKNIGLNTPKTYSSLTLALKAIENNELHFPLILKPRWGTGSIGLEFPENIEELKLFYKTLAIKLKKTVLNSVSHSDFENAILIQEKIIGQEYGMDIVNDFDGNFYGAFSRKKILMKSGETDVAESVINEKFLEIGKKIAEALQHIGILDCDFFISNKKIFILELNPRFGGGYPFSHEAGINIAAIYIKWLKGDVDVDVLNKYKSGVTFSKCSRLLEVK